MDIVNEMQDEEGSIENTYEKGHENQEPKEGEIALDRLVVVACNLPKLFVKRCQPLDEHINSQLNQCPSSLLLCKKDSHIIFLGSTTRELQSK
jgi:hypothetical protein